MNGNNKPMLLGIAVVIIVVLTIGGYYLMKHPQLLSMQSSSNPAAMMPTKAPNSTPNLYLMKTDPKKGTYLTDFAGMTLYTYSKDTAGVSNCTGNCAVAWPPYSSGAAIPKNLPTDITLITRADGSKQFAWKGMPLYYFQSDTKAGDITGDGVGGFLLAK